MPYTFTYERKRDYLHVKVTGDNGYQTVINYLGDVLKACEQNACPNVLIEENLKGPRLDTLDIFKVVGEGSREAVKYMQLIAYVDVNTENGTGLALFAESLATAVGFKICVFNTVQEAELWLDAQLSPAKEV